MPEIKGIEELLTEAYALLDEAAAENPVGGLWRERVSAWGVESTTWLTGFKGHQDKQPEIKLDDRVSNLEQAMVSLAVSVSGMQTLVLQGNTPPGPTQWEVAQQLEPEREVDLLDGSKIKLKDVPLDPKTGMPEEEWAMKNCPCPTHEEKRSRKAAAEQQVGSKPADPATGMYL